MEPEKIRDRFMVDGNEIDAKAMDAFDGLVTFDATGRVWVEPSDAHRDRDRIALFSAGKALAHAAQVTDGDSVEVAEVAESLGLDGKVVSARFSELKKDGLVEAIGRGSYRARLPRIARILQTDGGTP